MVKLLKKVKPITFQRKLEEFGDYTILANINDSQGYGGVWEGDRYFDMNLICEGAYE